SELISIFIDNPHYWAIVPVSVAKSIKKVKPININFLAESPPNRVCYKITSKDSINRNGLEIFEEVLSKNKMNLNYSYFFKRMVFEAKRIFFYSKIFKTSRIYHVQI